MDSSKKNELRCTICEPLNCYQEVILIDHSWFEKNKINRQYLWAATFPVDEAGYLSHYQYSIYKEFILSTEDIGQWEMFMFISGLLTFFWVTGIIQSLLPLYHRNKTYRKVGDNGVDKSPEIFNAFLLLCFFSLLFFILGHSLKGNFSVFHNRGNVPFINLLLLYILLSSPVCLIEYIYLLNNRSYRIFQYGLYTFVAQLIFIITPILLGKGIIWSIYGLLLITGFRWIWLIILLRRYTEMKISVDFIKEHLYLGIPLIITTLISGSAQYTDGIIISAFYRDPAIFACVPLWGKRISSGAHACKRTEAMQCFQSFLPGRR